METAANDVNFCLQKSSTGELKLKANHKYYYQVCIYCVIHMPVKNNYVILDRFELSCSAQASPSVTSSCSLRRNCM